MSNTSRKAVRGKKLLVSAKNEVDKEKIARPIAGECDHTDKNYCSDHHDTT